MTEFNARIAAFAAQNKLHLHVNTQGTCDAGDWQNELHLNNSGWTKVAQAINASWLTYNENLAAAARPPEAPVPAQGENSTPAAAA